MKLLSTTALALVTGTAAMAGGLDRANTNIGVLFEKGNYAELSFGRVMPNQVGTFAPNNSSSGNMASDFSRIGAAVKFQINDQISAALFFGEPYGADASYEGADATYPLAGTTASFSTTGITAVGKYDMGNGFSAYAGIRSVSADSSVKIVQGGNVAYALEADRESGMGYLIGAAYEIPSIALRASLTYQSKIAMKHGVSVLGNPAGEIEFDLPEQITLDFQTGIAPGTLLMAQINHARWTQTELNGPGFPGNPLVSYGKDSTSYSVGIGRAFSKELSGSVAFGWERGEGSTGASNLSPSNGNKSLTIGAKYAVNDQMDISGGVSYQWRGSTTTENIGASFDDNTLLAVGVKVGYHF